MGGVPSFINLTNTVLTQEGILDAAGITWMGCHIDLTAVPTVAPAAGTRDNLVMGITRAPTSLTTVNLDPSNIATRSVHRWAWMHDWPQPYAAAAVAATQTIESHWCEKVRAKRLLREFEDAIILSFGSQNAGQTWHIDGLVNSLWMIR